MGQLLEDKLHRVEKYTGKDNVRAFAQGVKDYFQTLTTVTEITIALPVTCNTKKPKPSSVHQNCSRADQLTLSIN